MRIRYDLAESHRKYVKQLLVEPLKAFAVTICPSLWSDSYENISYFGLNIIFIDANQKIFPTDLLYRSFFGAKTNTSVIKVSYLREK